MGGWWNNWREWMVSHPVSCKWVVCATELVFEAWCCTSKFCSCCTDLNQLVWGNPVAKHRGASLDGISRFYFVASCLPATLLCDIIKAKHFNIGISLPAFGISLLRGSQGQSSRIRIRRYELFRQQTGEYDLTKHAGTFSHSFFPFFGPSFLFFCFSGGNALQKRKAGCLGAANYSSRSKRTLVVVASMWWIEEVEKGGTTASYGILLFSLTTPLRNQGCRKEPWERLIAGLASPSSLPGPVAIDNSLLLTLSIGLLSARRLMALAIDIFAIQLCIIVRIHTPYEKRLNSPCIQDERTRESRVSSRIPETWNGLWDTSCGVAASQRQ